MIFILLPAYNEALSLPALLPKIADHMEKSGQPYRVVTCNDGSADETQQVLDGWRQRIPLDVIHHKINRGLGETSRDLFEFAAEAAGDNDVIVRMDCDDTHGPQFITDMAAKLDEGYDVVIASRFAPGGGQEGVSAYRAFISRCANVFMKLCFPIKGVREYSCGYRAYRASIIKEAIGAFGNNFIQLKGLGFTGTLEKLVKLRLLGARFTEAPFVLRYDLKKSESKMITSMTTLGYMVMAIAYHWPWRGWKRQYRDLKRKRPGKGVR